MKANGSSKKQQTVIRTERGLSIGGTRLTLYTIMEHLKDEWPPHLVRDWFDLTEQQMREILHFIAENRATIEAEYAEVMRLSAESEQYWRQRNQEYFNQIAKLPSPPGLEAAWEKLQHEKTRLGIS